MINQQLTKVITFDFHAGKAEFYQVTESIKSELTGVTGEQLGFNDLIEQFIIYIDSPEIILFKELVFFNAFTDSQYHFPPDEKDKYYRELTQDQYNNLNTIWPELLKGLIKYGEDNEDTDN